ncbi:Alpha/Beta hydrolase protein [Dichotomopilus funicola]|uniref:Alpha/Beta hydrolase protein n=1 Tax=Dichotomopilus funicola TaxID=1934379 RepID=A0AAN6ZQ83_9PEZI|nr:Alpha/Beta hydrolase protein [Dichotomopilus funicola]
MWTARIQAGTADFEARFEHIRVTYKTVDDTQLEAAVFIPKTLTSRSDPVSAPVLVHFHGGALITGAAPDLCFLSDWVRDLAHTIPAIFISPSYRLAPETPAVSILDDIADFWRWLPVHLPSLFSSPPSPPSPSSSSQSNNSPNWQHITPDLTRLLALGESAGGYLALQSALLLSVRPALRAVVALYPAIYPDLAVFNSHSSDAKKVNEDDNAVVTAFLAARQGSNQTTRTSTPWPGLLTETIAAMTTGRAKEVWGPDEEGRLELGYALQQARNRAERKRKGGLPPIWVVQGTEDTVVPKKGTDEMVKRLREEGPEGTEVKYTVREGGHGFDIPLRLGEGEEGWVREGVEWVRGFWLGGAAKA